MIYVSDAYKSLVQSRIRPKCEPTIKAYGTDSSGNYVEIIWKANNIKDLTFNRAIDPIGREIPYMELKWSEICTGDFSADNFPEKYKNVDQYMQVELSFVQNISFYNNWKTLFGSNDTWKSIFDLKKTWKQIKNENFKEVITMPKMFLVARPIAEGKNINWVARDFLYFCDKKIANATSGYTPINFFSVLHPTDGNYSSVDSSEMVSTSEKTWENLLTSQSFYGDILSKRVFINDTFSSLFLNYTKIKNYVLHFLQDGSVDCIRRGDIGKNITLYGKTIIPKGIMYNRPKLVKEQNMSEYNFSYTESKLNENQNYELKYTSIYEQENVPSYYVFDFNGFGVAQEKFNENVPYLQSSVDGLTAYATGTETITVTPFSFIEKTDKKTTGKTGIAFKENNKINPFNYYQNQNAIDETVGFFSKFFDENNHKIECEALPMLMLEPLDVVYVDSGFRDEPKQSIITKIEISYNGSIRQKMSLHECDVD